MKGMLKWLLAVSLLTGQIACTKVPPAQNTASQPPLKVSQSALALMANGFSRTLVITAVRPVKHVKYSMVSPLATGITVSPAECGDMQAGDQCKLFIHPGVISSAAAGATAHPSTLNVQGVGTPVLSVAIHVLTYGSVYQEGYVFALDDSMPSDQNVGGKVIALTDIGRQIPWYQGKTRLTGANSLLDGKGNTQKISLKQGAATDAATLCANYQIDSLGRAPCQAGASCYAHWYLPSICELGSAGEGADCASGTANLEDNLLTPYPPSGIGGLTGAYWSSTEATASSAWLENFVMDANSPSWTLLKNFELSVRCARSLSP